MAHRIETKVGQGVSYQLQVSGTPPITCQVISGPSGTTIDPTTNTVTVPGTSITEPLVYAASVMCTNCDGAQSYLSLQINATEDFDCVPITPPTTVRQQFVYNTAPVKVPQMMVGIHGSTHQFASGEGAVTSENPAPDFAYDFIRSHDASTPAASGDQVYSRALGMWRNIEYSPGQYDFGPARRWAEVILAGGVLDAAPHAADRRVGLITALTAGRAIVRSDEVVAESRRRVLGRPVKRSRVNPDHVGRHAHRRRVVNELLTDRGRGRDRRAVDILGHADLDR